MSDSPGAMQKDPPPATPAPTHPAVVFVNLSKTWGGGEQWHFSSAQALAQRGWPVALVVRPGSVIEARAKAEGLECIPISLASGSLLNPFKGARIVRELKRLNPVAVIL